jgi:hypothetical protein
MMATKKCITSDLQKHLLYQKWNPTAKEKVTKEDGYLTEMPWSHRH